jgi:hypothetical protein
VNAYLEICDHQFLAPAPPNCALWTALIWNIYRGEFIVILGLAIVEAPFKATQE